ncbi:hypothetical protein N7613_24100 [Pseudomonas juntendi]|uniref:hypothetical protein n=1 Tax=Pseudomonas juntendi TaxID=2666183 RepID=UPI00244BEA67|nr:hypothetical protein [Pseudomonas juntendi]MDG9811682.1 hypothetical protein [Pseudomonas juntendi]
MKLETLIYEAFVSFSKAHTGEEPAAFGIEADSKGRQLSISSGTESKIKLVSLALLKLNWPGCIKLDLAEHQKLTKKAILEAYVQCLDFGTLPVAARYFSHPYLKGLVKSFVVEFASFLPKNFTCHLPAASTGLERNEPYVIGPVKIYSRMDWIDSIDYPSGALDYAGVDNSDWRENLKSALVDKEVKLKPLSASLYGILIKSKCVISVATEGYGEGLSQKLSTIMARTALDSISLIFGKYKLFRSLMLYTERRPPILTHSLVETDGFLWLAGAKLSDEVSPFLPCVEDLSDAKEKFLEAVGRVLTGLTSLDDGCPGLCQRWSTALDWHGEACREVSDQIAIAKFGTCLDVLSSGGGKTSVIANMVSNLTKIPVDDNVVNIGEPLTLYKAISKIYENGRSEILHGNKVDRMTSFESLREMAEHFSRITLISAALAYLNYSGADSDKAFCEM